MEENREEIRIDENVFQQPLPNGTTSLVLGILSIVLSCCCLGIPGLILGIIGLILGINATKLYREDMNKYTSASYKNATAGFICSIIGLAFGVFIVISILSQWDLYVTMFESIKDGTFDPNDFINY